MFLTEKELKETFWKNYNYSRRAIKYQFECSIRIGNADLITIEKYQDNFQINAFEFKLSDIKKALLQAKANAQYVNKSWIVIPSEKADLIRNRYLNYLEGAPDRRHHCGRRGTLGDPAPGILPE
ncbi:MAG: hypothetical protein ACLR71_18660 [[Clostridium] scindens]